ncbi:hypothetical protein GGX14DRAFT_387817 [Mycena pura]|uniref:Uncharacterized protein n=1 Tax=Mycena pura TaxID=153505 RepID=A0AAD6YMG3_9AGAR|nr:hypothetical protein GGX14DRAFT_387817 [Mycena pura]
MPSATLLLPARCLCAACALPTCCRSHPGGGWAHPSQGGTQGQICGGRQGGERQGRSGGGSGGGRAVGGQHTGSGRTGRQRAGSAQAAGGQQEGCGRHSGQRAAGARAVILYRWQVVGHVAQIAVNDSVELLCRKSSISGSS